MEAKFPADFFCKNSSKMATFDDKLLGEKRHYYCSSSEDDEEEEKDQVQAAVVQSGSGAGVP